MASKLDDFILKVRTAFFARNPNILDFTDDHIKEAISKAISEFSRHKPRRSLVGSATITTGEDTISLPSDFMQINKNEIMFLLTGARIPENVRWYGALSVFDSEISATLYPPPTIYSTYLMPQSDGSMVAFGSAMPFVVRLTTDDNGLYVLQLNGNANATVTRNFFYDGFHILNANVFSVPVGFRDVLEKMVFGHIFMTLARDLAAREGPVRDVRVINNYIQLGEYYMRSTREIAPLGFST